MTEILSESIFDSEHVKGGHGLFEMTLISYETDSLPYNVSVWVYGEQGIKPPHFHVKIDDKYEFEIKFDNFHDLKIWRSRTNKIDWEGYEDVKQKLFEWYTNKNWLDPDLTNLEAILLEWNMQNHDNKIDRKNLAIVYNEKLTRICI